MPEDAACERGDGIAPLGGRRIAIGHHRGAGADANEVRARAAIFEATNQHGDISALPSVARLWKQCLRGSRRLKGP